jgi:hypothetical protein
MEPTPKRLRIFQQNLNNSDKVQYDLVNSPDHKDWDRILLQEPYLDKLGNMKANHNWRSAYNVDPIYHEAHILSRIPPYPAILGAPTGYLTRPRGETGVMCGFCVDYFPGGCIQDVIERSHVPLVRRSKWASQIVSAVWHLHRVAHTFHGDIKLDNVILDPRDNALLINVERFRANRGHISPEPCGEWDVSVSEAGELAYLPHYGMRPESWNTFRE